MVVDLCFVLQTLENLFTDINRVSKTRFPGGHHVKKCQLRSNQNMKIEFLRLDL